MFCFRPYSVDSSSWSYGRRFGWLHTYLGRGKWARSVSFPDRAHISEAAKRVVADLGVTDSEYDDPARWREADGGVSIPMLVCVDSYVRYSVDVYHQFGVRLFLACAMAGESEMGTMLGAIERHLR